jgi:hypothetical protein
MLICIRYDIKNVSIIPTWNLNVNLHYLIRLLDEELLIYNYYPVTPFANRNGSQRQACIVSGHAF